MSKYVKEGTKNRILKPIRILKATSRKTKIKLHPTDAVNTNLGTTSERVNKLSIKQLYKIQQRKKRQ